MRAVIRYVLVLCSPEARGKLTVEATSRGLKAS